MATRMRMAVIPSTGGIWELAENATMRLPRGRFAVIVRAERGTLLITQEGDPEDHVLESGDEIVHELAGRLNHRNGGRGVYFADADGHNMELLTRP
jgi:catechol 2,3-dioxygenase-like lactoylglutathione lyase family enzyme